MSHKEIDIAKYTEELARLMDVLIVRYQSEQGHWPSGYVRAKLRTQVVNFLADRFPGETVLFRDFLQWQSDTIGGTLRSIRGEEVPAEHKVGFGINNSLRGKLSAQTRYRNTGLAAFRSDRNSVEERKKEEVRETLNRAFPMNVTASPQAIRGETRNELDWDLAIQRFRLAIDYCAEQAVLFPADKVTGLMMGMTPELVKVHRESSQDRYSINEDAMTGGWWISPHPQKTLMEKVMEKLAKMDMDELAALADLIKDSD